MRSTPAVAITLLRYLFQSCVRASEGGKAGRLEPMAAGPVRAGAEWIATEATRWLDAEAGVRRSKMRRVESEETEERMEGLWGEKAVL
jgi:hypothetical protein